jgi:Fic family protein
MNEWLQNPYNNMDNIIHIVASAGWPRTNTIRNHVKFEKIHPFEDGNGRIGRILLNWQRVKAGLPILTIYEKDKHAYYKWFE